MTPEEIVGIIGNIANRPDLRAAQERQVREINTLLKSKLEPILMAIQDAIEDVPAELEVEAPNPDEMSEEEVAKMFQEKPKKKKREKIKKLREWNPEEIESWEAAQNNSHDIYKVSARIKNAARMAVKGNLTAQGDMLANSFTHVIKAFYDFAETVPDKETRVKLIELTRKQEEAPANLIAALSAGVGAPK